MWQPWRSTFIVCWILVVVVGATAEDLTPQSPLDLVRGLREQGQADLALEYLTQFTPTWPAELKVESLLERAKCHLELASVATDDSTAEVFVAAAKQEFDEFLKANPKHPRTAEAAVSLARLVTLQGRAELQMARRLTDEAQKKAALEKCRALLQTASMQYSTAAAGLQRLVNQEGLTSARKRELTRDYYQSLYDEANNYKYLALTFIKPQGREIDQRDKYAKDSQKLMNQLYDKDPSHPIAWIARATALETYLLLDNRGTFETEVKKLLEEGRKTTAPAGAAAGVRVARALILGEQFTKGDDPANLNATINACRQWLSEYPASLPTPQTYSVQYYLATSLLKDGLRRENLIIQKTKPTKPGEPEAEIIVGAKPDGLNRLREADAIYRQLVVVENDYKDRAGRQRARAIRYLVGNPDRAVGAFANFDELYMAALLQFDRAGNGPENALSEADKKLALQRAVELLEAARKLPVAKELSRDAAQATTLLARIYTLANRPYEGAILAESLCKQATAPGQIAKLGALAMYGYEAASQLGDRAGPENRTVDRERMFALAEFVQRGAPNEAATNDIRLQLAILYSQLSATKPMYDTLAKIPNGYNRIALARLLQGVAAYELLRQRKQDEAPDSDVLPADQKKALYRAVLRDMASVSAVRTSASRTEGLDYYKLRLQLAQLHLLEPAGVPEADKIAKEAIAGVTAFPDLDDVEKRKLLLRLEMIRIKAVYARAMTPFLAGQFKESADVLAPLLAEIIKAGPAVKPDLPGDVVDVAKTLDSERIRLVLVPLLQARLREGAVERTAELLDQLKAFGGDLLITARVVQQGVASIRPTVETLKAEGKAEEAAKLITGVSALVNKLATEKNLPQEVLLNLGRSFRDLGEVGKAVELFERIGTPEDAAFLSGEAKEPVFAENIPAEEQKKILAAYEANKALGAVSRQAKLELLRGYRAVFDFTNADAILDNALGKELADARTGLKDRPGAWAAKFFDFRREALYLLEAKGTAAKTLKEGLPYFSQAMKLWDKFIVQLKAKLDGVNKPIATAKLELDTLTKNNNPGEEIAAATQKVRNLEKQLDEIYPLWHDVILEKFKVTAAAYTFESKMNPAKKIEDGMAKLARNIVDLEKGGKFSDGTKAKLLDLLTTYPSLAAAYNTAGGKLQGAK